MRGERVRGYGRRGGEGGVIMRRGRGRGVWKERRRGRGDHEGGER